jgi:membrane protease subunit HflK
MYLETLEEVYKDADKILLNSEAGSGVVPYLPLNELNKNRGAN